MKAQIITQFGDPSVFQLTEIPVPELKPGYVLIKVLATSVNQIDCKIRSGAVDALAPSFPAVLHGDVAGVISAVASDVTHFKAGDEVYACAGGLKGSGGALAEWMLADCKLIAKKPRTLSMLQAAALPLVSITAWEALFIKAKLSKEDHILIHGGVGGVGHIALQLARWAGAQISTTVMNSNDVELAKSLGANHVINAREEKVADYVARLTHDKGFNVVFDTVGGSNLDNSFQAAAKNGTVVTTAARSTHDLTPLHNKALSLDCVFMLLPILDHVGRERHGHILNQLAELADQNQIKPLIDDHHFNLENTSAAHALLESGKAKGKIIITI